MLSRIKFEFDPLVEEILDQIPESVWASKTSTWLDPAIGGGQFVRAIESRLARYGHSKKNIAKRVFGFEESDLHIRYAINKYKLVGNYTRIKYQELLEKDIGMKFDVVVGNPPYQSGKGEKGGKHSLWRKFVQKAFSLVDTNGIVAMVCPGFPYNSKDLSKNFLENTPLILNNDVSSYFQGIGSDIKYWIVKEGKHDSPFIVDGVVWKSLFDDPTQNPIVLSITSKTRSLPVFECKQDKGYNSTQLKNDEIDYFASPTRNCIYPIRHASTIKVCYVSSPTECHYKNKVMMTFSGYPDFEYFDGNTTPISSCYQMSGYIEVSDHDEGRSLIDLYSSKLYRLLSGLRGAGMKGILNYSLPKVDLTRSWTDQELYQHFGLTQEEIDYIESTVK